MLFCTCFQIPFLIFNFLKIAQIQNFLFSSIWYPFSKPIFTRRTAFLIFDLMLTNTGADMRKNTFRSPSQIKHHLEEQRNSGVSISKYCRLHRIKSSTFWNWRKKYTEEAGIKVAQFAQVIPVVMVRSSCDEQILLAVLKAVKHASTEQGADQ